MEENQDSYELVNELPDGSEERKIIVRIPENRRSHYKELGQGAGPVTTALSMASRHCPNFFERVAGYTVSDEGLGKMIQDVMKTMLPDHPQADSGGFTYTFYEEKIGVN